MIEFWGRVTVQPGGTAYYDYETDLNFEIYVAYGDRYELVDDRNWWAKAIARIIMDRTDLPFQNMTP